jgi:flagellar motor switch protein FliG
MSDLHNAAVLLMTLPEDEAGELMTKLEPKQVEQVSIEIARTRTIASDEQERVIKEWPTFASRSRPRRSASCGTSIARTC